MKNKDKKKNLKLNKKLLITIGIMLAIAIGLYFIVGLNLTLILMVGLSLLLLFGKKLDDSKTKKSKRKVLKTTLSIILIFGIVCLLLGVGFIIYIVSNAPDFDKELLKEKQSTILYDSEGNEYAKLGTRIRENIEYKDLSEVLIDAIIATEDSRFFQHNGVDLPRFMLASLYQIMGKKDAGGASTLSMQVVKTTFTSLEDEGIKGIIRKFTDIYISMFQLEKNYTKEQIIEFYVNNQLLGAVWGVQEASRYYFGKDANELNLSEAAMIAGMFKSPITLNPYNYPENATKRRNRVLYLMEYHGYITHEERMMASSIPIQSLLNDDRDNDGTEYQGFIDTVAAEARKLYGVDPYSTSLLIETTMVRNKQDCVNKIMNNDNYRFWKDIKMQGATTVIDSHSGRIEAIGTGRHRTGKKNYNYALDAKRQIGSTAKPLFDYALGMELNNWSTYTIFDDEKGYTYSNGKPISNFDGKFEGPITLRRALSNSRNIPALKAFQQIDNKKIIEFVTTLGLKPEISNGFIHEAHSIGAFTGSNVYEMAGAYQIFSNGGYYYKPYTISKITFRETGEVIEYSSPKQKMISDSTAYMITDILKQATSYHQKAGLNKDSIASKSGTTNVDSETIKNNKLPSSIIRDYWTVGYTPDTVISVWIGYDELDKTYRLDFNTDTNLRYYLFNEIAKGCLNHTGKDFPRPKSVVSVKVEKLSDPPMLPSEYTPDNEIITELFKVGTEPTEVSPKYMKLPTPRNFNVKIRDSKAYLSWGSVKDPGYVTNDNFGYHIYFNGNLIGFTLDTTYTIDNLTNYEGEYSVKAGYEINKTSASLPATFQVLPDYNLRLNGNSTSKFEIDETVPDYLFDGTMVRLSENGTDVTLKTNITISIVDQNNNTYTTIPKKEGVYTVKYNVSYKLYTGTIENKITITEKKSH